MATEIQILQNVKDVENIRSLWNQMQSAEKYPQVNADIDRFLSYIDMMDGQVSPYVLIFRRNNTPIAMIVGRIEDHCLPIRLGYKIILRLTMRCLVVVYGGVLCQKWDKELHIAFAKELRQSFSAREFDCVFFSHLATSSPISSFVKTWPNILCRDWLPKSEPHWCMSMPETLEEFLKTRSSKHRSNLRRYRRKMENSFPGRIRVQIYHTEEDVCKAIADAEKISVKTYQHALGVGIVNKENSKILFINAARRGWFRGFLLYVDGKPIAFEIGLKYGNTYYLGNIGYDPKWRKHSIGTVLFLNVLQLLCNDKDINFYDFGFGDAEYKSSYGDIRWNEASQYIFALRPYPVLINLMRTVIMISDKVFRFILSRIGVLAWIKRLWRQRLSKHGKVNKKTNST
jgi:hypothetical protein